MAHENSSESGKENFNAEMEVSEEEEEGSECETEDEADSTAPSRLYLPSGQSNDQEKVDLECDQAAYICYHSVKTGSPCLSFDIIPDDLGSDRADKFPLTMTIVGGTEVKQIHSNTLLVMKLTQMNKNKPKVKDESESDSEDEDDEGKGNSEKPGLYCAPVKHDGCVNRVKTIVLGDDVYAASWSELRKVHIWNLTKPLSAVNDKRIMNQYIKKKETVDPVFTFTGHTSEGFAMEWSPIIRGMLATGDCSNNIHLWKPTPGGSWEVNIKPFIGHTASVEDIQWSPNESNVMASCSVDRTIRVWDMRAAPDRACMLTKKDAHDADVNVISWNKTDPFILSGGDDGKLRVWDLRQFPDGSPVCTFKYHTGPITSVEWHPTDASVFAASSADDILSQWDLSVERDEGGEEGVEDEQTASLPPQLLFLHQGQKEVKELHWHRQMPGVLVSTANEGVDVIRTISV